MLRHADGRSISTLAAYGSSERIRLAAGPEFHSHSRFPQFQWSRGLHGGWCSFRSNIFSLPVSFLLGWPQRQNGVRHHLRQDCLGRFKAPVDFGGSTRGVRAVRAPGSFLSVRRHVCLLQNRTSCQGGNFPSVDGFTSWLCCRSCELGFSLRPDQSSFGKLIRVQQVSFRRSRGGKTHKDSCAMNIARMVQPELPKNGDDVTQKNGVRADSEAS